MSGVEQEVFDGLMDRALQTYQAHPLMRFGLTPDDPTLVGLFAHMFLHAGWLHLLGNMLILYLAGPFIEDVWGRPLYLGFYVLSGLAAALFHLGANLDSSVPMIGASGAIAGVMGAFLVRYRSTKIRFFYLVGIFIRGTFDAPAWLMLPLWFAQQIFFGMLTRDMDGARIAYWAHAGGFGFGALAALALAHYRIEERYIDPRIVTKVDGTVLSNRAVERAVQEQTNGRPAEAYRVLARELRRDPGNYDAALMLWTLAGDLNRRAETAPCLLRVIDHDLRRDDVESALQFWGELQESSEALRVEPGLLVRLALAFRSQERDDDARVLLRRAVLEAGTRLPAALGLKLARAALELEPRLAQGVLRIVTARPTLGPVERRQAEELQTRLAALLTPKAESEPTGSTNFPEPESIPLTIVD